MQIANNPQVNFKGAIKTPFDPIVKSLMSSQIGIPGDEDKIIRAGSDMNFRYFDDKTKEAIVNFFEQHKIPIFCSEKVVTDKQFQEFSNIDIFA